MSAFPYTAGGPPFRRPVGEGWGFSLRCGGNRSGTYTEILYGPIGGKLALMNGQTVIKAFIPLPGGATAVYTGPTLSYFRHPDWLGSSRFASTAARTMYYSGAYAPFGEAYAEAGLGARGHVARITPTATPSFRAG
jgi:hypothetical protein